MSSSKFSGIITLNDLNFSVIQPDIAINNLKGQLAFNKDNLEIQSLNGNAGSGDFQINGSIVNIIPYFFNPDEKLYIDSKLESRFIDLQDWISSGESADPYILSLPDKIVHRLESKVDWIKFKRFDARNVSGAIMLQNEALELANFKMDVSGGHIKF